MTHTIALRTRPATLADLPAVAALFDAYRQFYEQPPDLPRATAFMRERLERRESLVLLAEGASGQALGFCQLYPSFCSVEAAAIQVLYDLYVAPAGRRAGVGRCLLLAAESQAHQAGVVRLDLTTAKTNVAAQALYESLGWVRDTVFLSYNRRITLPSR